MQQNTNQSMGQVEMQQCIQDTLNCSTVCTQTAKECQKAGGDHAQPAHVQMLQDCAEMCTTAAHFMQHNSALVGYACSAAAQVTNHCANKCEQMGDSNCANACRNASWSLDQMTKMIA